MIIRVFQVTTHPGKEDEFRDFFRNEALPLMRRTPGVVSVTGGEPRPESPNDFCIVMVWADLEALKNFVGEDYLDAHILPEEAELVQSRRISHYELTDA